MGGARPGDDRRAGSARRDRRRHPRLAPGREPVEQGEGDSFVAAFSRASDAVACALEIQRQLTRNSLRLRMGVHTGEVQLRDEGNYVGPALNRTARLRDAAHGGQVVLSQATCELVRDRLPDGAALRDPRRAPAQGPRPARARLSARTPGAGRPLPAAAKCRPPPQQLARGTHQLRRARTRARGAAQAPGRDPHAHAHRFRRLWKDPARARAGGARARAFP